MPAILHKPSHANGRRILVSGAGIAGPALAYWLHRYGFTVTMVEQSDWLRLGGYPVDLRGTAIQVADRMGLMPDLLRAHINSFRLRFVDGDGHEIATVVPEWVTGGVRGRDVELSRDALASLLISLTRHEILYRFSTSITALSDGEHEVDVTFDDGRQEQFDLVIGADGMHSGIRRLAFGPERDFARPMGFCFAGFSAPNMFSLNREVLCANVPGRMVVVHAVEDQPETVHAIVAFAHPYLLKKEGYNPSFQRDLTSKAFAGAGWKLPQLMGAMHAADDFSFDTVQQIHMPVWSTGRIALVGDAAYAPSFLTGQDASLALVGAYVLAGELALHPDHRDAFAAYDRKLRPFVDRNQATVDKGRAGMIPSTSEQLAERNASLNRLIASAAAAAQANAGRAAHTALDVSEYDHIESRCPT